MKIRCDVVLDLDTGDYRIVFHNLSRPGQPMEVDRVRSALAKVMADLRENRLGGSGELEDQPPA